MKKFLLKNLSRLVLTAGVFLAVTASTAFAASVYQALPATGTVGVDTTLEIEYTVDTAVQTWADADTLTIQLPANYPQWASLTYTVEYDTDVTNDATGETAITAGAGNGQYVIATDTMTVKWDVSTWGAVSDTSTIRVVVTAGDAPTYVDATSTITFAGATVAGDTDPSGTSDVDVSVGALTATNVEPASLYVGEESVNTISFTTTAEIPADGLIVVTYPAGFDVSGANAVVATNLSGIDGTLTAAVSGQVITLTRAGGGAAYAGAVSFTIDTGIINQTYEGTTGTYTILTQTSDPFDIETDVAVAADEIGVSSSSGGGTADVPGTTDFTASIDENLHAVLAWTNPAENNYQTIQVIRSKGEGVEPNSILEILFGDAETYTDENLAEGDVVNYQIRPIGPYGSFGPLSEVLSLTVEAGATTVEEVVEEVVTEEPPVVEEVVCEEGDTACEEAAAVAAEEAAAAEEVVEEVAEEAPTFSDIAEHWAEAEVNGMAAEGIVDGNPDGTFTPNGYLNRAEAAALLYRLLGYDEPGLPDSDPFSDVSADAWYAGYVSNMKSLDMIHGYGDGTYGPGNNISRAEFTKVALEVYYFVVDDEEIRDVIDGWMEGEKTTAYSDLEDDWYTPYVTASAGMGFTHGFACGESRCFGATDDITRAEATVMLYNIFYEYLTAEIVEEVLEEVVEEVVEEPVV